MNGRSGMTHQEYEEIENRLERIRDYLERLQESTRQQHAAERRVGPKVEHFRRGYEAALENVIRHIQADDLSYPVAGKDFDAAEWDREQAYQAAREQFSREHGTHPHNRLGCSRCNVAAPTRESMGGAS